MHTLVVLAMHGAPPTDFPQADLAEYVGLHAVDQANYPGQKLHRGFASKPPTSAEKARYAELDHLLRSWPRTEANDPFYMGSLALAQAVSKESHLPVIVGFNEFCSPSLDQALEQAATEGRRVLVITPMMTSGGSHSEVEIPLAIQHAREKFPDIEFIYAWPFSNHQVATFLATQIARHLSGKLEPVGWR